MNKDFKEALENFLIKFNSDDAPDNYTPKQRDCYMEGFNKGGELVADWAYTYLSQKKGLREGLVASDKSLSNDIGDAPFKDINSIEHKCEVAIKEVMALQEGNFELSPLEMLVRVNGILLKAVE